MSDSLMQSYRRLPVTMVRGEGAWLWDAEGHRYLDALCGVAVTGLGHAHPHVTAAIAAQAARLLHCSNVYRVAEQEALAERLAALSGMDRAFFCNSGAEANEAAIKLARLHGHARGIDCPVVVVAEGAFHGRTLATLTAGGNRKAQQGFEPLVQGFLRVPYGDAGALRAIAASRSDVAAVLLEPVQGEGGINIPPPGYLRAVRGLCDEAGWLLMLDEVQSGIGRTGRWFAHQHEDIVPDVMQLAKALGNGVPIGACLARGGAAALITPGSHGSTFGGNPLACRAALAVIEVIERDGLLGRATHLGRRIAEGLGRRLAGRPEVVEVRERGLMIGVELDRPCGDLVAEALAQGLLINVTAERVIRLVPPLILSDAEADQVADGVATTVDRWLGRGTGLRESAA